jgi:flagellar assembly protein FliH
MSAGKKFTFDVEFRPEGDLISNAARARQRRVFTQEEIDHMFSRARQEGMKAGQIRATEALAAAVERLCGEVSHAMDAARGEIETLREEAALVALAAARKLAPVAVAALPAADVEEALREAIHQAISEPRIVLRAAPGVIAALKDRLTEIARDLGFEGRIVASADPGLTNADCRIEWRGGGAERSMAGLEAAIGSVIARRFSQTTRKG